MFDHTGLAPDHLLPFIGRPDAPHLVDVCLDQDFAEDPFLIPAAIRVPHGAIRDTGPAIGDRGAIIICQKGLKLSQGAAARLRAHGCRATHLIGGAQAWAQNGFPRVPASRPLPTTWVVPADDELRDVLAAWFVKRLITPAAELLWVQQDATRDVADRFDAEIASLDTGPLPDLLPRWPVLGRFRQMAEAREVTHLLTGARHLHLSPEACFAGLTSALDLLFAAAGVSGEAAK